MARPPRDLSAVKVVVINLDRRADRWEKVQRELAKGTFREVERLAAVDGQKIPDSELEGCSIPDRPDAPRPYLAGAMGCTFSWRRAVDAIAASPDEWTLVIEDDSVLDDDFDGRYAAFAAEVPEDAILLPLGLRHAKPPEPIGPNISRVRDGLTTTAFLIPQGSARILRELLARPMVADWALRPVYGSGSCYCPNPHLIIQGADFSDIMHRKTRGQSRRWSTTAGEPVALKAKSSYTDGEVREVWETIADRVTADEAAEAVDLAAAEVRSTVAGKRAVYGWSGGKDSAALQVVCEAAGVDRAVLGIVGGLEWREYLTWVRENAPPGLKVYSNPDVDLAFLGRPENRRLVFPENHRDGYWWTLAGTRRAQLLYQQEFAPDLQIYGRRTQDGNACGDDRGIARGAEGYTTYCPIRSWSHELTLGVVHHFGKPLPPLYGRPHGWTAGTGPWPGRRVGTEEESWAETYAIEPEAVRAAAHHLPGAYDWLEENT